MIQRKQTLFLIIALALTIYTLFSPIIKTSDVYLSAFKLNLKPDKSFLSFPIAVLLIIDILLTFVSIFAYKRRVGQMRLVLFTMLLSMGYYGLIVYYHFWLQKFATINIENYSFSIVSMLIVAILQFLAYNGIKKDEKLVRDSERIR